jgi:hypothetical protein
MRLPGIIRVQDYHEFSMAEDYFQQLDPDIRVKEIGFCGGEYLGTIYKGSWIKAQQSRIVIKAMKEIREEKRDEISNNQRQR